MTKPTNLFSMLSIDDEVSIQMIIQNYFKTTFNVKTKSNGKQALEWLLEGNIPDIIIADMNMPEMDGYTFISHIKSSGYLNKIPVIMLSANNSTDIKIHCLEAGADDFMAKPFNPKELGARINGILRRSRNNNF